MTKLLCCAAIALGLAACKSGNALPDHSLGTITDFDELAVGDLYLADGSFVSAKDFVTEEQKSACIGVVIHLGHHEADCSDYSDTGIGNTQCNGYVAALSDATALDCVWGEDGKDLGLYPMAGGKPADNAKNYDGDWSGYMYTQTIMREAAKAGGVRMDVKEGYPATFYAANDYLRRVPAPECSSGWFLPAIGQVKSVFGISDSLTSAGGTALLAHTTYWSSSEMSDDPFRNALTIDARSGNVTHVRKEFQDAHVRAILAF